MLVNLFILNIIEVNVNVGVVGSPLEQSGQKYVPLHSLPPCNGPYALIRKYIMVMLYTIILVVFNWRIDKTHKKQYSFGNLQR